MEGLMWGSMAGMRRREGRWEIGSIVTTAMFIWLTLRQLFPFFDGGLLPLRRWSDKLFRDYYPFVDITFPEFSRDSFERSAAFVHIESYLSATCGSAARCLRAELGKGNSKLVYSMDQGDEVVDRFEGVSLWWSFSLSQTKDSRFNSRHSIEGRSYKLSFHRRHRSLIEDKYLTFVMEKGKEMAAARRQRKLFTNTGGDFGRPWSHVPFEHPATFQTIAMDPSKKEELIKDLLSFRESKDYYARVGKAWKRGYLLYGPPGTGKSSLIAAMANLLEYDVYDLELTAVNNNSSLRGLLIEMNSKSIVVVEDIDCSLDLTGSRKIEKKKEEEEEDDMEENEDSKVTLSGLLNFIDGLWSASAGERIIVFTTNHVDKLDPALIRRGRMDMHIELSYCRFEAFKMLARNYLGVDDNPFFGEVRRLLEEVDITPADVAELLMTESRRGGAEAEESICAVVQALKEKAKETEKVRLEKLPSRRGVRRTLKRPILKQRHVNAVVAGEDEG